MSHMWRQYGTLALLTLTFSLSFILIHINSLISFLLFICDFFLLRQPHCRRLNDSVLLPPIYSLFYSSAFISVHHAVPSMPLRSTPHHYFLTVSCYLFFSSLSCPVLSNPILSFPILSYPILSYPILSYGDFLVLIHFALHCTIGWIRNCRTCHPSDPSWKEQINELTNNIAYIRFFRNFQTRTMFVRLYPLYC